MLFNSFIFIFGFLPVALIATYGIGRFSQWGAKLALTMLSLGFYAWWRPVHLPLLLGSIVLNFLVGDRIQRAQAAQLPGIEAGAPSEEHIVDEHHDLAVHVEVDLGHGFGEHRA